MSAHICSNNHISAIVRWAAKNNIEFKRDSSARMMVEGHEQEAFTLLLDENYKSVNYRYSEEDPSVGRYKTVVLQLRPIEIIKLSHSLAYQSCEHPGWDTSEAKALLERIEEAAVRALPGYEAAPWRLA